MPSGNFCACCAMRGAAPVTHSSLPTTKTSADVPRSTSTSCSRASDIMGRTGTLPRPARAPARLERPAISASRVLRTPRIHVERIERVARGHEQAVALAPAESEVGAALRQRDEADRLALGIEHLDPIELGAAHAPAAPQVAVHVDTEAVGRAIGLRSDQDALVDEASAVVDDVIPINGARVRAAVLDVTFALVGRKLHAVRQIERALHHRGASGPRVETIDVRWQLGRRKVALIIGANAERGIGEPDRVIGLDGYVVRRIEALALEAVHQHGDRPVVFGARDASRLVLAADEAPLAVARIAIGVI